MAFNRPTIPELKERIYSDIDGYLEDVDPRLRRSLLGGQVKAEAGVAHGLYGYLAYIARQIVPSTADEEYLQRHADWWGVPRKAATAASGNIDVIGEDGAVIAAGVVLQRADGIEYTVSSEAIINGTTASVAVVCGENGQDGNAEAGENLTFVSPVNGVQGKATVDADGLTGGTDIEQLEVWRQRFRDYVQNPPQGGCLNDYKTWALEVSGVTRAWVMPGWLGVGTVAVFVVRDNDNDFIPDAAEVETVQTYIDEVRTVTAVVTCLAPEAVAVDMTIRLAPNSSAVQAAVMAELADLFLRESQVEDGTGSGTLKLSRMNEAVSLAAGESDHEIVLPVVNPTFTAGQIAKLGTVTFQDM